MKFFALIFTIFFAFFAVRAQTVEREFTYQKGVTVEIKNLYGRVRIEADEKNENKAIVRIMSEKPLAANEIIIDNTKGLSLEVLPQDAKNRVDIDVKLPLRARVRITTGEGEVRLAGNLEAAEVFTGTGTISAQVPLDDLRYNFLWTASRPRFLSEPTLEKVKEKSAGKFQIKGKISQKSEEKENGEEQKKPAQKDISLNLTTARGIILLNVNPSEVPSDLRERKLTEAAKAIIRSGDSLLMEAIRRASPKFFGDYAATLPPIKRTPFLSPTEKRTEPVKADLKKVLVKVTDINNRAIADLKREDFEVSESGREREIISVEPTTAPFNLVLLLDVSGSVENYVDFIRKAARSFVNTASPNDRIAIVIFNEDVKTIATFTTDKGKLSESLDTFDAGGSTAYYDALAFSLVETLRPLRGERSAIIALTDGDDNRSFLPFDSLLGSIQESGALVYPLYVPSELIAATANNNPNLSVDTLRTRYMGLTSRAEAEGEKLAQISGGVYYPIRQLSDLQKAYDDIVVQLRTAYTITFRSDLVEETDKMTASPRLKVKVKRANTFVKLGSVVSVEEKETSEEIFPQRRNEREENLFINASFANLVPVRENFFQSAEISGDIEKIKYRQFVNDSLRTSKFENFDINKAQGAFLLTNERETIAVSRWISPKRTRSYPYERVYDTLAQTGKKVAIIPVVKDEGLGGDRDFLQWDTISLLSLLDVRVVLAYYDSAEKNTKRNDQITAQKFDNNYILSRLNEVFNFNGTAREWNEREIKQLKTVFEKAKSSYAAISKQTNTYLHDATALDELIKYAETPQTFIEFSRNKSQNAQNREFVTEQPKEALLTDTKAKVTINNALFGRYFFTCDETKLENKTLYLIEAKHSQRAKFPSKNDIKDGMIKMMLYTNLSNVKVGKIPVALRVMIRLTSNQLKGSINSDAKSDEIEKFFADNSFDSANKTFFQKIFTEARENKFTVILEHAETAK